MKPYFFACLMMGLTACSAGGSGSLDSYDGLPSGGSGAEGSTDVSASCKSIVPDGIPTRRESVTGSAPPLRGGELVPGRYVLTVVRSYGASAPRTETDDLNMTLVIGAAGSYALAAKTPKGTIQSSGRLERVGDMLTGTVSCVNPPDTQGSGGSKPSAYEASEDKLVMRGTSTTTTTSTDSRGNTTTTTGTSEASLDMVFVRR